MRVTDEMVEAAWAGLDNAQRDHWTLRVGRDEMRAALEAALATVPQWIACEERLPEDRRLVLLIATNAGPRRNYTTDHWVGWYNEQSAMWSRWPHSVPPTHWMPLPAAPEGQR